MSSENLALVADIGGTWARFAVAQWRGDNSPVLGHLAQVAVADHDSLVAAARHFLDALPAELPRPDRAVLAVAGKVDGDEAALTNHPWQINARECSAQLALHDTKLINDFTAQALAVPHLRPADRLALNTPPVTTRRDSATYAVLGPGTGLGVSGLLCRAGQRIALESEGGHAAFAPKTARQRALLEHLSSRYTRVSYERLLSGAGLSNLHWALSRMAGATNDADLRPEQVTQGAVAGDPLCTEAIEVFCEVLGAFAGDLVLTFGSWDGVYLSGGLVPLLIDSLRGRDFREAFQNKGRFSSAVARVPVHAVLHPQPGLLGAAARAFEAGQPERPTPAENAAA
ncbi:glucokinase [Pseudomarimonas salicorniae]|uniref:Glucokinase n=1 Tax=Pseudomarimonas salicorniae TaxID=2933270 RepID=A0ABT0GIC3_9GAMM|nr:glucokinase [Lysobacter sp. CAU 1642]MCK7594309.1 glucokinase [Lysobacter sp. CAU 1642]